MQMKSLPYQSAFIFSQKCMGASYKHIHIFFVVPLRGHFLHTSPARISILFFCLLAHGQPHQDQSDPKKIFDSSIFHYTLLGNDMYFVVKSEVSQICDKYA